MENVLTLKIKLFFDILPQSKKNVRFVSWDVTIVFGRMKLTETPLNICLLNTNLKLYLFTP